MKTNANPGPSGAKRTLLASFAAVGSVILASSCCLPLAPFLLAAGSAGSSAFFTKVWPFLLGASVLFIAYGFYPGWRAKRCKQQPSVVSTILLWASTLVVLAFILFPQAIANLVANLLVG